MTHYNMTAIPAAPAMPASDSAHQGGVVLALASWREAAGRIDLYLRSLGCPAVERRRLTMEVWQRAARAAAHETAELTVFNILQELHSLLAERDYGATAGHAPEGPVAASASRRIELSLQWRGRKALPTGSAILPDTAAPPLHPTHMAPEPLDRRPMARLWRRLRGLWTTARTYATDAP